MILLLLFIFLLRLKETEIYWDFALTSTHNVLG